MNKKGVKATRQQYIDKGRSIYADAQERYGGESKLQYLEEAKKLFQAASDISKDSETTELLEHTTQTINQLKEELGITQKKIYFYPKEYVIAAIVILTFIGLFVFFHVAVLTWLHKIYDMMINYPSLGNLSLLLGIAVIIITAIYQVVTLAIRVIRSRNMIITKSKVPIRK